MKNFVIETNTDFKERNFAEGVIFNNGVAVLLLKFCNSPFLVQNDFNEAEALQYVKDNSYLTGMDEVIAGLKVRYLC